MRILLVYAVTDPMLHDVVNVVNAACAPLTNDLHIDAFDDVGLAAAVVPESYDFAIVQMPGLASQREAAASLLRRLSKHEIPVALVHGAHPTDAAEARAFKDDHGIHAAAMSARWLVQRLPIYMGEILAYSQMKRMPGGMALLEAGHVEILRPPKDAPPAKMPDRPATVTSLGEWRARAASLKS